MKKKEQLSELKNYVDAIKNENGNAVIDVNLSDKIDLYNPMSMETEPDLSNDIYDYIDEKANIIPAEIPLCIRFHGDVNQDEQQRIKEAMRKHYIRKSYDIIWDIAANTRKMIALTIFGIIVLALYFFVSFTKADDYFIAEILSIVGSFSLWEAADSFLLERPRLRREYKNIMQNIDQKTEFIPKQ